MKDYQYASEFDERMRRVKAELALDVGDIYEDCAFHPVLCIGISYEEDEIWGVSLVDGSQPRNCSLRHCGVRKLTVEEAWNLKIKGPTDESAKARISEENRWWVRNA